MKNIKENRAVISECVFILINNLTVEHMISVLHNLAYDIIAINKFVLSSQPISIMDNIECMINLKKIFIDYGKMSHMTVKRIFKAHKHTRYDNISAY